MNAVTAYLIAISVDVLLPVGLALWCRRRYGVRWRYLGMGALVFLVSQLLTRIPAMKAVEYLVADALKSSEAFLLAWIALAALTAGLFEEIGRFLGWKVLLRKLDRSFEGALMYGVGHGGLESALLVGGLAVLGMINTMVVPGLDPDALGLGPEQVEQIREAKRQIASMPGWLPLLGAVERVFAICVQLSLSVLVVQCFVRGSIRWLWIAIGWHAFVDLTAMLAHRIFGESLGDTWGAVATEGLVGLLALVSLLILWRLRPSTGSRPAGGNGRGPDE